MHAVQLWKTLFTLWKLLKFRRIFFLSSSRVCGFLLYLLHFTLHHKLKAKRAKSGERRGQRSPIKWRCTKIMRCSTVYCSVQVLLHQLLTAKCVSSNRTWWFIGKKVCCRLLKLHSFFKTLPESLDDRVISCTLWFLYSTDLTPCDYYLWGSLKHKACKTNPHTLQELRNNIRSEISANLGEEPQRVNNFFTQFTWVHSVRKATS